MHVSFQIPNHPFSLSSTNPLFLPPPPFPFSLTFLLRSSPYPSPPSAPCTHNPSSSSSFHLSVAHLPLHLPLNFFFFFNFLFQFYTSLFLPCPFQGWTLLHICAGNFAYWFLCVNKPSGHFSVKVANAILLGPWWRVRGPLVHGKSSKSLSPAALTSHRGFFSFLRLLFLPATIWPDQICPYFVV